MLAESSRKAHGLSVVSFLLPVSTDGQNLRVPEPLSAVNPALSLSSPAKNVSGEKCPVLWPDYSLW